MEAPSNDGWVGLEGQRLSLLSKSSGNRQKPALALFKETFQNHRAVVLLVAGREDEGDRSPSDLLLQQLDQIALAPEFGFVALGELLPSGWIVPEPFSQLWAGGDVFQP